MWDFPCSSLDKESTCNAGDPGSIPGLGRSPGEGNGSPLQPPCLKNPMDRGTWWATVHGVAQSPTRLKRLRQGRENTCSTDKKKKVIDNASAQR